MLTATSRRKLQRKVSLSNRMDNDVEGNDLSLMDVTRVDDTVLEGLDIKESSQKA